MAEAGKGVALAILGVVAVLAVVGLVLLFKAGATGKYVVAGEHVQWNPVEVCGSIGGSLVRVEGGIYYSSRGPLVAVCNIGGQQVRTPIVRPFDWREEYYAE